MALVETVTYAQAFSFKYSPRPGTPAADATAQVDEAVKAQRLARLQALLNSQQRAFNESQIGKNFAGFLFEKPSKQEGQIMGRSPYLQPVHVPMTQAAMAAARGRILPVEITAAHDNSLGGRLASSDWRGCRAL